MKKIMRWGSLVLALGLLLAAAGFAFHASKEKRQADAFGAVTLYLEKPIFTEDSNMLHETIKDMTFTAWRETPDVKVMEPFMGHETRAGLLMLEGSSELVLPFAPVLPQGDVDGCLLGEETAWELFGSTRVVGNRICIGSQMRIVRGVVNLPQSGVVLGGDMTGLPETGIDTGEAGVYYDRITIESRKVEDAEKFLVQSGLDGKILRLDYLSSLRWLVELIPGKWSDFPGWEDNFTQKGKDFELLLQVNKNSVERYYLHQSFLCIRNRILEAVCVVGALLSLQFLIELLPVFSAVIKKIKKVLDRNRKLC